MKVVNEMGVPWQVVPPEKLDYITRKNHQGVIAWISAIEFQDIENLLPRIFEEGKEPLLLMLDGVSDVRNFGAIVRSASCFGAHAVIIPEKSRHAYPLMLSKPRRERSAPSPYAG